MSISEEFQVKQHCITGGIMIVKGVLSTRRNFKDCVLTESQRAAEKKNIPIP